MPPFNISLWTVFQCSFEHLLSNFVHDFVADPGHFVIIPLGCGRKFHRGVGWGCLELGRLRGVPRKINTAPNREGGGHFHNFESNL